MIDEQPLPVIDLLAQGCCCGSGCANCPYVPQHHAGTTDIDEEWVKYATDHPQATYADYQHTKNAQK